ncbi:hypothetical protein [Nitrosopumilus sp.]|uniref:hypothetical protein n=1 Tax=Nitrosopumilus sp. TaxID=2024843 RepID=UPI003D125443
MEIKNQTLFFIGIIVLILGILIIIFDYPQIQYLENYEKTESNYRLNMEQFSIYQRLLIEISVGTGLFIAGIGLLAVSFLKRFENRLR